MGIQARLSRIAAAPRFRNTILVVIGLNAVVLGLQTYDSIDREIGGFLTLLDGIFLGVFVVELAIRIGAYGRRPQDFFKSGWNVFDFVVIGVAFVPGLRSDSTLLRLARLFRVVRIFSVLPDLRVLVRGMAGSLAPIASLSVLAILVMYIYGMLGWILFGEGDPERWGDIGDALLTLFVVMTLESWPDIMGAAMEITSWAWVYFVSYVLVASFLIINVVIAIIITSVEEAHAEERRDALDAALGGDDEAVEKVDPAVALARVRELRAGLEELEEALGGEAVGRRGARMASKGRLRP